METISAGWGCLATRQTVSSAAWEHNMTSGGQEMNPTANGDLSPQIKQPSEDAEWEMWELTGLWMVCRLGKRPSHSWSQVEKNLDIRCHFANSISQAQKRDLDNCRLIQCPSPKEQNYCLAVNGCLNYFFFSWTSAGFRRSQPGNTLPTTVMHNLRGQPQLRGHQPQSPALPAFASICMDDIRREVLCLSVTDMYAFPRLYCSIKPG